MANISSAEEGERGVNMEQEEGWKFFHSYPSTPRTAGTKETHRGVFKRELSENTENERETDSSYEPVGVKIALYGLASH